MTNPTDYILKSDVEKMIEEKITDLLPTTSFGTNIRDSFKNDTLQELLQKFNPSSTNQTSLR